LPHDPRRDQYQDGGYPRRDAHPSTSGLLIQREAGRSRISEGTPVHHARAVPDALHDSVACVWRPVLKRYLASLLPGGPQQRDLPGSRRLLCHPTLHALRLVGRTHTPEVAGEERPIDVRLVVQRHRSACRERLIALETRLRAPLPHRWLREDDYSTTLRTGDGGDAQLVKKGARRARSSRSARPIRFSTVLGEISRMAPISLYVRSC